MDQVVHLETSLLILPACAGHADRQTGAPTEIPDLLLLTGGKRPKRRGSHGPFSRYWRRGANRTLLQLITLQWVGNMERRNGPRGPFPTLTVVHTF